MSTPRRDSASASACCLPTTTASPLSCPRSSKSRPWATRRPSIVASFAWKFRGFSGSSASLPVSRSALRSQYSAEMNAMRSRSRSTMTRVATDWTRPADNRGMTFFHRTGDTS